MKRSLLPLLLLLANSIFAAPESCAPQPKGEEHLYESDFPWNQTLEDILKLDDVLYESARRLPRRAYKNSKGEFVVPVNAGGKLKDAKLPSLFIKSITAHVEEAFKRRYVDALHFGDMGHSHFFIPQPFYDQVLDPIPVENMHLVYEKMFAHKDLKILYHSAEQLVMKSEDNQLLPDRHLQWRFFTRNLVGDNRGLGRMEFLHHETHNHNTANDYDSGFRYWGGGHYISANKNGCFPFTVNGRTRYFDLNLVGIDPKTE
jgi:hypothetical protein